MYLLRFREWPILIKIITISIISVTFITLVILLYFMPLVEQKMLDGKKEGLKNVVDVAYGIFQEYDSLATNGPMSHGAGLSAVVSISTMSETISTVFVSTC